MVCADRSQYATAPSGSAISCLSGAPRRLYSAPGSAPYGAELMHVPDADAGPVRQCDLDLIVIPQLRAAGSAIAWSDSMQTSVVDRACHRAHFIVNSKAARGDAHTAVQSRPDRHYVVLIQRRYVACLPASATFIAQL